MKNLITIFLLIIIIGFMAFTHEVKGQDAFMGYDYVTTTYPLAWTTSATTFNDGTAKEVIYAPAGGGLYTATTCNTSSINGYQLNATAAYVEMNLTANSTTSTLTSIAFTGSTNNNTTAGDAGVVFSSEYPFNPAKVIGASAVPFPAATGEWIVLNPTIPEGAKSMRIYRRVYYNATDSIMSTSTGTGYIQYGTGTTIRLASLAVTISVSGTAPTVTTTAVTNITQTTASSGGNVTDAGTADVTVRGVCWSLAENPTVADSKTEDGAGIGSFTSSITGLTSGTTYYVRAYATSTVGTSYGAQETFSTLSGVADIVLSSTNPAVPSGDIAAGSLKNPVYKFNLAVTVANTQLNQVNFMTEGTYTSTDVTKLQFWFNTADDFGNAVQIGSDITSNLGGVSNLSFGSLTQGISTGETGYLWITADVSESATAGRVISIDAVNTAGLTFSSGNKSGTAFGGALQTIIAAGNPDVHFRTKVSGDWNTTSTWESSLDSVTWVDATLTPNSAGKSIHVRTGHTVTVTDTVSVDQVIVAEGATILVNGTPVVFTIVDGLDDIDMLVNGTVKVTGTPNTSPGPYSVNAQGVVHFGATGVYEHNQNAGAIPVSVWNTGSTIKFTGIVGNSPANGSQNFYNIIWDCPAQTANLNLGWSEVTIGGDINVLNTNTGRWQFCAPVVGASATVNIMGDVSLTAGNLTTNGTGNANTTIVINHFGNINVTGGNFSISRGSQSGSGTSYWNLFGGNFTMSNATTQNSNPTGGRFIFKGTSAQSLTLSGVTYGGGGLPIIVDSSAVVNLGNSVIAGTAVFTVNPAAKIITSMESGFDGNLTNTGAITLSSEASYGYNGTVTQSTGTLLPAVVNGISVNNSSGVNLGANLTVNGQLEVTSGYLNLNGNDVTFGPTAVLSEAIGATVTGLTGKLTATRTLNAPTAVNVAGMGAVLTSASNLGETVVERYHSARTGNNNTGVYRYYRITPTTNTGLNATLRFYYDETELQGNIELNLRLFKSATAEPNSWVKVGGTVNTADNYVELSGINDFSYWTLSDSANPIPVEFSALNAVVSNNKATITWETASETNNKGFEVERTSDQLNEVWTKVGYVQGMGNKTETTSYLFKDNEKLSGNYSYRLKQIDFDGSYSYSNSIEVDFGMPMEFGLSQNYPNPFNPSTTIEFQLPSDSDVEIKLYDILGNEVSSLLNEKREAGFHSINVKLQNLSTGIYYYRMSAGNFIQVKKMLLVK
jgi:hypothetical protein